MMNQSPLSVRIRNVDDAVVFDLTGRLIMGEAESALRQKVRDILDSGTQKLAFNLSEIKYIDSSGIGCLAAAWTSANKHKAKSRLYAVPSKVMLMLKISRLDSILEIMSDETSALADW